MSVDGKDFSKEVSRVNETRYKDKAEELGIKTRRKNCWPALSSLLKPIETHVYRLGLLRSHRISLKTDGTFVIDEEERGYLLGVAKGWLG